MPRRLTVLKFGSSILRADADLPSVVHEIYRFRRAGDRVLAVLSAYEGETTRLCEEARQLGSGEPGPDTARYIAQGEWAAVARLGLVLDRAGIPHRCLDVATMRLFAEGGTEDAAPVRVDRRRLLRALAEVGVVVVPGFVAEDARGEPRLLGRGGSDLTAVFLAHSLKARRCRLVKDVDALFDRDPAGPDGVSAKRFRTAHSRDALALDGRILQAKAVRWAEAAEQTIEIGGLQKDWGTRVGALATRFDERRGQKKTPPLRVALAGFGTVGQGVASRLLADPRSFELVGVLLRNRELPRGVSLRPALVITDSRALLARPWDVLIEVLGGTDPALGLVANALRRGKSVVTANKSWVAEAGPALTEISRSRAVPFLYSAAVGGGVPVLEVGARWARRRANYSVTAVLNGTSNFVLDRLARGTSLEAAIQEAQRRGFAELDPSRDLSGRDAADKLVLLTHAMTGQWVDPASVEIAGGDVRSALARAEPPCGVALRQVARLEVCSTIIRTSVRLETVSSDSPLAEVAGADNVVVFAAEGHSALVLRGRGAGRWPTTESIMGDLYALRRRASRQAEGDPVVALALASTDEPWRTS